MAYIQATCKVYSLALQNDNAKRKITKMTCSTFVSPKKERNNKEIFFFFDKVMLKWEGRDKFQLHMTI